MHLIKILCRKFGTMCLKFGTFFLTFKISCPKITLFVIAIFPTTVFSYSKSEGVDYPPLNRSKINLDKWKDQFMLEEVHSNQVQKFAYGYDLCGLR